ncbi:MAG: hypothetical protein WA191_07140 [Telluria sp.]
MSTATLDRPAIEPTTALTLPQRAAVALGESANATKLRELVTKSAGIVTVTNPDGRDEAHRAGMVLVKTRTNIEKTGKAAREDATAFSKAVIAMEKDLIAIIEPEELRVLKLRDAFDEQAAAEKAAKIAAERERMDAIQARIAAVRNLPTTAIGKSAAEISQMIYELAGTISADDAHAATFEEFAADYKTARTDALELLAQAEAKQLGIEAAAREAEQARIAEAARMESERAELARQRAEAVETARIAKIEAERVANEQAIERQRLAALAAAQELAAAQLRAKAEANLKADREAQELAMRLERERVNAEQLQAAADLKAAIEAHALEVAAHAAKLRVDIDHAEALEINAAGHYFHSTLTRDDGNPIMCNPNGSRSIFCDLDEDYGGTAELARSTETAQAMPTNGRSPALPESYSERDALIDAADADADPGEDLIADLCIAVRDLLAMQYTATEIREIVDAELAAGEVVA